MEHHIDELRIDSLRRLRDLHLPQLGRFNLLVGENNSGKTTALEALALFCRPLDPLDWLDVARRRAIKSSRESVLENVRWLFPQNSADANDAYYQGEVRIQGQGNFPCLESVARFNGFGAFDEESLPASAHDEDEESAGSSGREVRGAEITLLAHVPQDRSTEFDANPDGILSYRFELLEDERFTRREPPGKLQLPLSTVSPFSHRVEQLQVRQFTEATLTQEKFSVVECVNLIDGDVAALEILSRQGKRPALWVQHKTLGYAPLYTLGDGVRRVLTIALGLIEAQNGVLLIDEIETAIHKDALVAVFQWLVRAAAYYNVQLFATTHSLEAVDAVLMAELQETEELVAFRLPENGNGQAKRFSGELLDNLRFERGLDIR